MSKNDHLWSKPETGQNFFQTEVNFIIVHTLDTLRFLKSNVNDLQ